MDELTSHVFSHQSPPTSGCEVRNAPGVALVVDQRLVGVFADTRTGVGKAEFDVAFGAYRPEDIESVVLACHMELSGT